jgi:tetratricopeptide (TPR) repeat protein
MNRFVPYLYLTLLFLAEVCVSASSEVSLRVRALLKDNRLDEALGICRQYEVMNTNVTDVLLGCAWVYYRTDKVPQAEKILEQTKKSSSSQAEYQLLNAYSKMLRREYDGADSILENIKSQNKGKPIAISAEELRGELKEMRDQLLSAAFIYKSVVEADPSRARAHWGLGRHYKNEGEKRKDQGDIGRAIRHLEKVVILWPKHIESRFLLAQIYMGQGPDALKEVAQWLNECYKINSSEPRVLEQLGLLFEKKGKLPEAIRYWQKTLEVKKDSKIAVEKLNQYFALQIDALMESKKWKEALARLDSAGKPLIDQPDYVFRRATILRNLAIDDRSSVDKPMVEKAIVEFSKYLRARNTDANALRELGICYFNLKKFDQANIYFSKAVAQDSNNGLNYAWKAFGFESKGDWESAHDAWIKAVELLKDPSELEKANRKLSHIEEKINKKNKGKEQEE